MYDVMYEQCQVYVQDEEEIPEIIMDWLDDGWKVYTHTGRFITFKRVTMTFSNLVEMAKYGDVV